MFVPLLLVLFRVIRRKVDDGEFYRLTTHEATV